MRIGVTGARGRVGSALVELALREGHAVLGLDLRGNRETVSERLSYEIVDLTVAEHVAAQLGGCDAVVHLAAHISPMGLPAHTVHNDNVTGSYNLLVAAADLGIKRICQASSINAIGASFSRSPRYDYLPVDEDHPTYNEDPYSLSKWICEAQAESVSRAHPDLGISSLRFHMIAPDRDTVVRRWQQSGDPVGAAKGLWGYTTTGGAARACLAALEAEFVGHEVFYVVANRTASDEDSSDLYQKFYPEVPLKKELSGAAPFFDCQKAQRLLSWSDR